MPTKRKRTDDPPPRGSTTAADRAWVWVTCPLCMTEVPFVSPEGTGERAYEIDDIPPEALLALDGAAAICPQCDAAVQVRVTLDLHIAARPLPDSRSTYASSEDFLIAAGWIRLADAGGAVIRWQHPSGPFALTTEAAVWQQHQWLLAALPPLDLADLPGTGTAERHAAPPLRPTGHRTQRDRRRSAHGRSSDDAV